MADDSGVCSDIGGPVLLTTAEAEPEVTDHLPCVQHQTGALHSIVCWGMFQDTLEKQAESLKSHERRPEVDRLDGR